MSGRDPDPSEDILMVNCAKCRIELVTCGRDGHSTGRAVIAGRIQGRPYCDGCLRDTEEIG